MKNGDLPARASPSEHANNMVVTMSLVGPPACEWAGRHVSAVGWKKKSEKFAGKVRISLEKWPKVRNSSQK
jgi:hypothetical protein